MGFRANSKIQEASNVVRQQSESGIPEVQEFFDEMHAAQDRETERAVPSAEIVDANQPRLARIGKSIVVFARDWSDLRSKTKRSPDDIHYM